MIIIKRKNKYVTREVYRCVIIVPTLLFRFVFSSSAKRVPRTVEAVSEKMTSRKTRVGPRQPPRSGRIYEKGTRRIVFICIRDTCSILNSNAEFIYLTAGLSNVKFQIFLFHISFYSSTYVLKIFNLSNTQLRYYGTGSKTNRI